MPCDKINTLVKWLEKSILFHDCGGIDTRRASASKVARHAVYDAEIEYNFRTADFRVSAPEAAWGLLRGENAHAHEILDQFRTRLGLNGRKGVREFGAGKTALRHDPGHRL